MYVDPSRLELLVTYAELMENGSEAELSVREAEVRLFVESVWAAASAEGRRRFMDAVGEASESMPWAAVMVREDTEGRGHRRPAALELVLGQDDLGDEGVGSYRLDPEGGEGRDALAAIRAWDVAVIREIAAPAGWRVERLADPVLPNERPVDDVDDGGIDTDADGNDEASNGAADEDDGRSEGGDGQSTAPPEESAPRAPWWPWAAVIGGLGVAGAMVFLPRKSGE